MSVENAKNFLEKMRTDSEFRNDIITQVAQAKSNIIKNAGFDFTSDEMKSVRKQLSDEDLQELTGGRGTHYVCNCCGGAV